MIASEKRPYVDGTLDLMHCCSDWGNVTGESIGDFFLFSAKKENGKWKRGIIRKRKKN